MDKAEFIKKAISLQFNYIASNATKMQLAQVDLVAIVGPTGVGKTTLMEQLSIPYVMSDVTRLSRKDEHVNSSYHFRTDYEQIIQDIQAGEYVQFLVSQYNEFYGTRRSAYPDSGKATMAVIASAIAHFRTLGFRSVTPIYIMPPSYVEWMRRIGGDGREDLIARINEARQSILTAQADAASYHFVLNDNITAALKDIHAILNGETPDQHRAQLAYDTADIILERIGDG